MEWAVECLSNFENRSIGKTFSDFRGRCKRGVPLLGLLLVADAFVFEGKTLSRLRKQRGRMAREVKKGRRRAHNKTI